MTSDRWRSVPACRPPEAAEFKTTIDHAIHDRAHVVLDDQHVTPSSRSERINRMISLSPRDRARSSLRRAAAPRRRAQRASQSTSVVSGINRSLACFCAMSFRSIRSRHLTALLRRSLDATTQKAAVRTFSSTVRQANSAMFRKVFVMSRFDLCGFNRSRSPRPGPCCLYWAGQDRPAY